jgi:hypothetical protein
MFACSVIAAKGIKNKGRIVFARPGTWISEAMMEADQIPVAAATRPGGSMAALLLEIAREESP